MEDNKMDESSKEAEKRMAEEVEKKARAQVFTEKTD
jgi:hypothetical protein